MARATDIFDSHADVSIEEVKPWLKSKGIRDLESVSLLSDEGTSESLIVLSHVLFELSIDHRQRN